MKQNPKKRILVLCGIFIILMIIVLLLKLPDREAINPKQAIKVLNNISNFTDTNTLQIIFKKDKSDSDIILKKTGDIWVVANKNNYPVSKDAIDNFFSEFKHVEEGFVITEKKKKWDKYELSDTGTRTIRLKSKDKETEIILGKFGNEAGSNYIAVKGSRYVFMVPANLRMFYQKKFKEWYKRQIFDMPAATISKYKVLKDGKESVLKAERNDTGWNILINKVKSDTTSLRAAVQMLSVLRVNDVFIGNEITEQAAGMDKPAYIVEFSSAKGSDIMIVGKETKTGTYIRFTSIKDVTFFLANYTAQKLTFQK